MITLNELITRVEEVSKTVGRVKKAISEADGELGRIHGALLFARVFGKSKTKRRKEQTDMYSSLDSLACELGLPRSYLRQLVSRGEIPFLRVRGWLRFDVQAVREALKRVAEQTAQVEAANKEQI